MTFPLESLPELVAYLAVFVAAALEGEVVFVTSCILVSQGKLSAMGVLLAAALGGSLGDQVYFYALRGRLSKWLGRVRSVAERQVKFVGRIRRHSTRMILTSRFLAGLRIAIPSACAYADVPPLKCTLLSLCSGFAWSTTLPKLSPGWGSEAGQIVDTCRTGFGVRCLDGAQFHPGPLEGRSTLDVIEDFECPSSF